jgi:hypothetical protein
MTMIRNAKPRSNKLNISNSHMHRKIKFLSPYRALIISLKLTFHDAYTYIHTNFPIDFILFKAPLALENKKLGGRILTE